MYVLGIFMEGPNTGACLLREGRLVAIGEEERFVREKRASSRFPSHAVRYCLSEAAIRLRDVDVIATAWDHEKYPEHIDGLMRSIPGRELDPLADTVEGIVHATLDPDLARFSIRVAMKQIDPEAECHIAFYSHHLCHAASVHYLSGFERSGILVMDGSGEEIATSIWRGDGDRLEEVERWSLPDSLGWFYAAMTEYLGFSAYSGEGKVMGLAPYGRPHGEIAEKLRRFCSPDEARAYRVDPRYVYYGARTYSRRFTDDLVALFGPPRRPESELTPYYESVAFETQRLLEEIAVRLARRTLESADESRLCISGGVAMNCKMNGVLAALDGVDDVFVNPASYDSGTAIGAALLAAQAAGAPPRLNELTHAYWGPGFSDDAIESALVHCRLPYRRSANVADDAASLLAEGRIVGWFNGRAEFGARALGARSILANPLLADVKERVNAHVKYREAFRPFAPSMIEEACGTYMADDVPSPFMLLAGAFREEYQALFPGVVHVDGTVRPQTVSRQANPGYWALIDAFGRKTGHPVILNTSFNVRGEPIVNTPLEAIRCYFSTGMDALAIGPFLLEKDAGGSGSEVGAA